MNKEPKSTDLLDWLHDIRSSWYQLGKRLMVDVGTLKVIEQSWQGQVDRKFSEVLTKMGEWSEISAHIYKPSWMSEKMEDGEKYVHVIKEKLRDPEVYDRYNSTKDYHE